MNVLNRMIGVMTKEEIRYFKVYATRITSPDGRKDLQLFDIIRKKGEGYNEKDIMQRLSGKNHNAFYRLKNRLTNDLNDFIALHNFDVDDLHGLNRDWILFNVYQFKRESDIAFYHLKKAEKKALLLENFEMLDLIYSQIIRLSNEMLSVNPEEYIERQKANAKRVNLLREMDQALAALTYRIRVTQNWGKQDSQVTHLLEKTIHEFAGDSKLGESQIFQTRLYRAVSQVLVIRHQYAELSKFVLTTYNLFLQKNWFSKENHELKLQMLTYLINALYHTEKYQESLKFTETLKLELDAFQGMIRDKFLFFFYNSLALNYIKTNLPMALKVIEQMESDMKKRKISYYDQFIYLNKAIVLHWLGNADAAIRSLVKLYILDSFKQADESFRFRILVAEQIMQFEAGDTKSFSLRLGQLQSKYKKQFLLPDFAKETELLNIMVNMLETENYKENKKIITRAKKFLRSMKNKKDETTGIIDYTDWVRKKFNLNI